VREREGFLEMDSELDILSNLFASNLKDEFNNYLAKHNYTLETKLDSTYNPLLFELFWSRGDFEWLITTHAFNPDVRDLQGRTLLFPPYCDLLDVSGKSLIIRCGVGVNAKDKFGGSAVYCCATHEKYLASLSLLLENGASFKEALENDHAVVKKDPKILHVIQQYQQSSENCKSTLIVFLKITKQHRFIHKDLVKVIAKMVWKTRRQKRVWILPE
jgi:hypothetical protein